MDGASDIGQRLCAHLGYLFNEVPLDARFEAAADAGFSRVEVPNPYGFEPGQLRDLLDKYGLRLIQINSHAGDPARNEKGLACLPGREAEFRQTVSANLDYAKQAGAEFLSLLSGVIPEGHSREELRPLLVSNIGLACDEAAQRGLDVLIEPIGPGAVPGYMMHDPRFALEVIEELGRPNLHMLFDTFHAAYGGLDPVAFVAEHGGKIGHLHLADFPGRHEPGTGSIDFPGLADVLHSIGYSGSLGLEYVPLADTLSGLSWRTTIRGFTG